MQVQKFLYKKTLYLNWYEAAIGHLLLFKYYVEKYSQNVYFLISEQGVVLKATTSDFLKKAEEQITKFFTAKIQQLQISGSADFYQNLIEDMKEQTDRLKDQRDCPYINLVYSQKLRNSCLALKKHGYAKPYQNWEGLQRERKGFCFLIVRPEHRWKQIANSVYQLARKRYPSLVTHATETVAWPIQICYEKFVWFYLKSSFKNFKKSLQIKENKALKGLAIIIKNDIPEFNDFEKEIESITFSYRPRKPKIVEPNIENKVVILSTLDIERITQLIYHQFGLTNFAKQMRRKMSGFLVISSFDISDQLEDVERETNSKRLFDLREKQDILCLNNRKINVILNKMGRRHSIVNIDGVNFVQIKIEKPIRDNYQKILNFRLPCLPRYFYWHESDKNLFLLRSYIGHKLMVVFERSKTFEQISLIFSLICVVEELHQRGIILGNGLNDSIFLDEKRLIIEPDEYGSIKDDIQKLKKLVEDLIEKIKEERIKHEIKSIFYENRMSPFGLLQYLEDYIDSNS